MLIYLSSDFIKFCRNASTQVYFFPIFTPLVVFILSVLLHSVIILFLILDVCINVMIVILLIQHVRVIQEHQRRLKL